VWGGPVTGLVQHWRERADRFGADGEYHAERAVDQCADELEREQPPDQLRASLTSLYYRIRPGSEVPPWVFKEIERMLGRAPAEPTDGPTP